MTIEIAGLIIQNGDFPVHYVSYYQRVIIGGFRGPSFNFADNQTINHLVMIFVMYGNNIGVCFFRGSPNCETCILQFLTSQAWDEEVGICWLIG